MTPASGARTSSTSSLSLETSQELVGLDGVALGDESLVLLRQA